MINFKIETGYLQSKEDINNSITVMKILDNDMSILMSEIHLMNKFKVKIDKEKINKAIQKLSKHFLDELNYQLLKIYINN